MILWDKTGLFGRRIFQKLLFPEGIIYNHEKGIVRTTRTNSFFSVISNVSRNYGENKKEDFSLKNGKSPLVIQPGFEPGTHSLEGCCSNPTELLDQMWLYKTMQI